MPSGLVERKLAAILAADIAGYSRLAGADEERTLARLRALRSDLIDPVISIHHGRVVKRTGDGSLVEFRSVVDAVRCALEVQKGMVERNAGLPAERRIEFRVGIHLGDVVEEADGDLMGDGVNIAARLEAFADAGGVCLSHAAYEQVRDKIAENFVDVGEHNLKNIARPVRVYRVDFGEGNATQPPAPALALPDKPSIAVLAFQNMSGDSEQEYFCDGMVEDIITGLARIKWLFVIARNSSFAYKGKAPDIRQVGRELGVRYVLEGSVRKAASRIRITAQLVDAASGAHLWAERYDRPMDDIFALQDEITLAVVGAIEPSLRAAEQERVKRKRPDSLDAYDLVLRAEPLANTAMPDPSARAIPLLERALALDPDYAMAHALLAASHGAIYFRQSHSEEDRRAAIRHARAAIAFGHEDPQALAWGGLMLGLTAGDRAAARDAVEAAIALSPSCALAYFAGAVAMGYAGEAELAIDWGERAVRLSPRDPLAFGAWHGLFLGHFANGRYVEAENAARKSVQSNPSFSVSHLLLAAGLAQLGRMDEAKTEAAQALALEPSMTIAGFCKVQAVAPSLAAPLAAALRAAGLPE